MNTTAIDVESRTLRIERDFRAPIEKVFEALTNPEHARQWWGPESVNVSEIDFDLSVGGAWCATMVDPEGGQYTAAGEFTIIERPDRLAYTWGWLEEGVRGHETTVDIRLMKIEGGTRLTLVHSVFETEAERDDHGEGWTGSLNGLEKFLG